MPPLATYSAVGAFAATSPGIFGGHAARRPARARRRRALQRELRAGRLGRTHPPVVDLKQSATGLRPHNNVAPVHPVAADACRSARSHQPASPKSRRTGWRRRATLLDEDADAVSFDRAHDHAAAATAGLHRPTSGSARAPSPRPRRGRARAAARTPETTKATASSPASCAPNFVSVSAGRRSGPGRRGRSGRR